MFPSQPMTRKRKLNLHWGTPNTTFRNWPAVHVIEEGLSIEGSTTESLACQKSLWVFRVRSFDDTSFRIAPNVYTVSERMYDAATELGLFPIMGSLLN